MAGFRLPLLRKPKSCVAASYCKPRPVYRTSKSLLSCKSGSDGGQMAPVVCGPGAGWTARCATLGETSQARRRGLAKGADVGLPTARVAGTMDGAHVGAEIGVAA